MGLIGAANPAVHVPTYPTKSRAASPSFQLDLLKFVGDDSYGLMGGGLVSRRLELRSESDLSSFECNIYASH